MMHPKLQKFLEAKGGKTVARQGALPGMDLDDKKKEESAPKAAPAKRRATSKKSSKKVSEIEGAETIMAPSAEAGVPEAPVAPDTQEAPVPEGPEPEINQEEEIKEMLKGLQTALTVNQSIISNIKIFEQYFNLAGAQLKGLQDEKIQYIETGLRDFDKRIKALEIAVNGIMKQSAVIPDANPPVA